MLRLFVSSRPHLIFIIGGVLRLVNTRLKTFSSLRLCARTVFGAASGLAGYLFAVCPQQGTFGSDRRPGVADPL